MYRTILLFAVMGFAAAGTVAQESPLPPLPELARPPVLAQPAEQPPTATPADVADPGTDETTTIRETVKQYTAAFNRGDAAALAAFWSEDSQFVAPSGDTFEGRQAIQEGFAAFFLENEGAQVDVDIASIRLDGPDSATEEGTVRLMLADQPPSETIYVANYKKLDGSWKLVNVRESEKAPSHYEQLKPLEWLIGQWGAPGGDSSVRTACRWTKNKNFISRSFAVSFEGQDDLEGTQVIGWDPDKQVIRSWLFDSDGGFAVALWSQQDNRWKITSLHVQHDGRKASSVNILTVVDENTFTWESTNRDVDGEVLPNIGPVTVVRQEPAE